MFITSHLDQELPHYNQIKQILSHLTQLTDHVLQKGEEQVKSIGELNYVKSDVEEKLLQSNSIIQTLEQEIQT